MVADTKWIWATCLYALKFMPARKPSRFLWRQILERTLKDHRLLPYYTSAYALYALEFLFRNQKIDSKYKIARFQILFALRLLANSDPLPQLNAHKMDSYCQRICEHLWDQTKAEKIFAEVCNAIDAVAGAKLDRDTVHTTSFTDSLAKHCVKTKP